MAATELMVPEVGQATSRLMVEVIVLPPQIILPSASFEEYNTLHGILVNSPYVFRLANKDIEGNIDPETGKDYPNFCNFRSKVWNFLEKWRREGAQGERFFEAEPEPSHDREVIVECIKDSDTYLRGRNTSATPQQKAERGFLNKVIESLQPENSLQSRRDVPILLQ